MHAFIKHAPTRRQMGGLSAIAAPLLAAAGVTVIGVIVQQPEALAIPGLALVALALAVACLITSILASMWVSYYDAEPPGAQNASFDSTPSLADDEYVQAAFFYKAYRYWVSLSLRTFSAGVYALWVGLAIALVPHDVNGWRLLALFPFVGALIATVVLPIVAPRPPEEPPYWVISLSHYNTQQAVARPDDRPPPPGGSGPPSPGLPNQGAGRAESTVP